jgi:hypothetical protein
MLKVSSTVGLVLGTSEDMVVAFLMVGLVPMILVGIFEF